MTSVNSGVNVAHREAEEKKNSEVTQKRKGNTASTLIEPLSVENKVRALYIYYHIYIYLNGITICI